VHSHRVFDGYGKVRRNTISLPLVSEFLVDPGGRYFLPENAPLNGPPRVRGASLKTLVRLALERDRDCAGSAGAVAITVC